MFLTAARPKLTEGSDVLAGTSLDQLYAQLVGSETPIPSIQLCIENVDGTGACGYGYACVYADTISWASPTKPLPMERDPRTVFERLFGDGGTVAERRARQQIDRSILDAIMQDVARLRRGLDAGDRVRLNAFLDDIREVEQRIRKIEQYNASGEQRSLPEAPLGVPDSFAEHVTLMFDLQALAFMANITRVSTLKMGRDASNRTFPDSGINQPFHSLSHHGQNPETIAEFAKLNAYHVSYVAPFLDKLKNTPDGDGNLLDHTLVDLRQSDGRFEHPRTQALSAVARRPHERRPQGQPAPEVSRRHADGQRVAHGGAEAGRRGGADRRQHRLCDRALIGVSPCCPLA